MKKTKTITIVGKGNVGTHLYKALHPHYDTMWVDSRTFEGIPDICDIIIIAVKDDVIEETAQRLKGKGNLIAHTSGSVPMAVLDGCSENIGVFYPMQTFSKNVALNYADIPFFIEGNCKESENELCSVARSISRNVRLAGSDERKRLHIAAVFCCNFTNHLIALADDFLHANGMDYTIMMPLIRQTMEKLEATTPEKAQTGPASRNDRSVIESHLAILKTNPQLSRIYEMLTDSIIEKTTNTKN